MSPGWGGGGQGGRAPCMCAVVEPRVRKIWDSMQYITAVMHSLNIIQHSAALCNFRQVDPGLMPMDIFNH